MWNLSTKSNVQLIELFRCSYNIFSLLTASIWYDFMNLSVCYQCYILQAMTFLISVPCRDVIAKIFLYLPPWLLKPEQAFGLANKSPSPLPVCRQVEGCPNLLQISESISLMQLWSPQRHGCPIVIFFSRLPCSFLFMYPAHLSLIIVIMAIMSGACITIQELRVFPVFFLFAIFLRSGPKIFLSALFSNIISLFSHFFVSAPVYEL